MVEKLLNIVILFAFTGLGLGYRVALGKRHRFFAEAEKAFNKLLYYVLLPLVFLDTFAKRGLLAADLSIMATAFIYIAVSITVLMKIPIRGGEGLRKGVVITSVFQNNVFLGFPVLMLLYNNIDAAATYSLVVFIIHIAAAGLLAASRENIASSIARIPIIYGFAAGTAIHYTAGDAYTAIAPYMAITHPMLSYGALFILGYTLPLTLSHVRAHMDATLITAAWRFVASPIIHYVLLALLEMPPLYKKEIMILSIMPPAVMNTVIARIYGWEPEYVASSTLLLTIASLAIIAVIMAVGIL